MGMVDYWEDKKTTCPKCGKIIEYTISYYPDGECHVSFKHED